MPWFHVTFERHVESIRRHGLGARVVERNWPECDEGVYLAQGAELGLMLFIERYVQGGDPDSVPRDYLATLRIVVVDDSRIDPSRILPDPSFPDDEGVGLYRGVIDVTGMPILDVDAVTPPEYRPGGAEWERMVREGMIPGSATP
jgi:hypothetical protein